MTQCTFTLIVSVQFIIIYVCYLSSCSYPRDDFQLIYLVSCLISACPNLVKNLLCDYGLFPIYMFIPRSERNSCCLNSS